ncbi:MAG: protein kinase domain-containing protein, partial [Steroidobacterales bacterium]
MAAATLDTGVSERPSSLSINTTVGEYRVDGVIGSGGMATVYRATQTMIGKRVAIKVMHRTKSDTAISRFVKEARAVNLIGHPNIVDVFGFGMTDGGRPYLVM